MGKTILSSALAPGERKRSISVTACLSCAEPESTDTPAKDRRPRSGTPSRSAYSSAAFSSPQSQSSATELRLPAYIHGAVAGHRRGTAPGHLTTKSLCDPYGPGKAEKFVTGLQIEFTYQLPDAHPVVTGDALQDARQGLHPDRIVKRDNLVMFPVELCRETHVRAALAHRFIAQSPQRHLQARPAQVAGQFHATSSSSRTK